MAVLLVLAVLSACSTIAGLGSYILVTRCALLERLATVVLNRGLRGISERLPDDRGVAYTVTRTESGVCVENLSVAVHALQTLGIALFDVAHFSVGLCEVAFPSFTQPLRIKLDKLVVVLEQRQLPKYMDPEVLDKQKDTFSAQLKMAKLAAVEKLLWASPASSHASEQKQKGVQGSRLRATLVHRILAFAVQYVNLTASELLVTYSQRDEPGPAPAAGSYLEGKDSLQLSIRQVAIAPQSGKAPAQSLEEDMDADVAPVAPDQPDMPAWMQMLRLPAAVWRHLLLREPRMCTTSIAGTSLTLMAYGQRMATAARPSTPAPANPAPQPGPSSSPDPAESPFAPHPATFTFGTNTGPSNRRRKRLRGAAQPSPAQSSGNITGAPLADDPWPTERHVILQSWGAHARLTVVPPGYSEASASLNPRATEAASRSAHSMYERPRAAMSTHPFIDDHALQPNGPRMNGLTSPAELRSPSHSHSSPRRESSRSTHDGTPHSSSTSRSSHSAQPYCGTALHVDVSLRALMPLVNTASLTVGLRMAERLQQFQQYVDYWACRPQVPVSGNAALWWQHAGRAAVTQCRLLTRSQVPMHALARRRVHRLKYQELYTATHAPLSSFHEPSRRWYHRRPQKADAADRRALHLLEERLTLEETSHFRAAVALAHSRVLARSERRSRHVMDAVDAIVSSLGPLQPALEAMLLQQDTVQRSDLLGVRVTASCPKLGVLAHVGEAWAAGLKQPGPKIFPYLEASLRNAEFCLHTSGEVDAAIRSICVGGTVTPGSPVHDPVLRSPSSEAVHLLRVTDLHAMASRETSFLRGAHRHQRFLDVHIGPMKTSAPEPNTPARTSHAHVFPHADVTASEEHMNMAPSSLAIRFVLAGIEVTHTQSVVLAALTFAGDLKRCKGMPLQRSAKSAPAAGTAASQLGPPQTLAEQVLQSFAQNNIPVHQPLVLPLLIPCLDCPGIIVRVPYKHADTFLHKGKEADESLRSIPEWDYQLVAALTRIRLQRYDDDFCDFMRHGALRRSYVQVYVDLFSYQPRSARVSEDSDTHGMRLLKLSTRRRTESEQLMPDLTAEAADEQDIAAMAKVWAHPEDLHLYQGAFWDGGPRSSMHLERESVVQITMPGRPTRDHANAGASSSPEPPFPMVPLLKVSGFDAEVLEKAHALPAAPGSNHVALAMGAIGIMAWVSPWQVAHVLSIIKAVYDAIPPVDPIWEAGKQKQPAAVQPVTDAMKTQSRLAIGLEVPLISVMCSVAKSSLASAQRSTRRPHRQIWGRQIAESDPAYQWSQHLSPVYGFNLVGIRAGMQYRGVGALRAGLVVDGILVRDLQMKPDSRVAHFLRPLPARAAKLATYVTKFRRRLLRLTSYTVAHKLWMKAVRKIVFTRRAMLGIRQALGMTSVHAISQPFSSLFGSMVDGAQLGVLLNMPAPHQFPGHPAYRPAGPIRLEAHIGQLLLHVRVSTNNRMLPFTMQLIEQISSATLPFSPEAPGAPCKSDEAIEPLPGPDGPAPAAAGFQGLQVKVVLVGLDVMMIVEGRELVALKLQGAEVHTEVAATGLTSPPHHALVVRVTVEDMIIKDLQAMAAHSIVLRPSGDADACSLTLAFHKPTASDQPALLVVEVANPCILALLRFVHDILHGVEIVMGSAPKQAACAGEADSKPAGAASGPPMELILHVFNAGIILPASSRSHLVLACDIEYLAVGVPGDAVPSELLAKCLLPTVPEMVDDSISSSKLFPGASNGKEASRPEHSNSPPRQAPPARTPSTRQSMLTSLARTMTPGQKNRARQNQAPHGAPQAQAPRSRPFPAAQPRGVFYPEMERRPSRQPQPSPGVLSISQPAPAARRRPATLSTPFAEVQQQPHPHTQQPLAAIPEHHAASTTPPRPMRRTATPVMYRAASPAPQHAAAGRAASADAAADDGDEVDVLASMGVALPAASQQPGAEDGEELPGAQVAVLAEGVTISRASLARVRKGSEGKLQKLDSAISHAWPTLEHDLEGRSVFLNNSSYAVVVFEAYAEPPGAKYTQVHLAASPILALINKPNYSALLGFAQGNLTEASSFQRSTDAKGPAVPKRFAFNPDFKFGPPAGDVPGFCMTAELPELASIFEADPAFWQSGAIHSRLGDIRDLSRLPFLRIKVQGVGLDLGTLINSKATYIKITAADLAADDLRLAYSKIMTEYEVTDEEGSDVEDGTVQASAMGPAPGPSSFETAASARLRPRSRRARRATRPPADGASLFDRDQLLDWTAPTSPAMNRAALLQQAGKLRPLHRPSQTMHLHGGGGIRQHPSLRGRDVLPLPSPFGSDKAYSPVISMENIEQLERFFPSGAPVVHLMQTPVEPPSTESAHLDHAASHAGTHVEATVAVMQDGTIAIEANLSHALVQWPFLSDISLVWAAASIFQPDASTGDDPADKAAAQAVAETLDKSTQQPWLYLNIVLRNSQLFLPVLDLVTMREPVHHYFGGGAAALNMHERLADILLMVLSLNMETPGSALKLEERGLAMSFSALRAAYSMGGDGESDMRIDVNELAAFVREPAACVTCFLLPTSFHARLEMQVPQAAELSAQEELLRAAIKIQRVWRRWHKNTTAEHREAVKASSRRSSGSEVQQRSSFGELAMDLIKRTPALRSIGAQSTPVSGTDSPTGPDMCSMDSLIREVATPRTRATLLEYEGESKGYGASAPAMARAMQRAQSHTRISIKLVSCTLRAAFSHIPLLQSLMWMVNNIVLVPTMGNVAADLKPPTAATAVEHAQLQQLAAFRPSKLTMEAGMQSIAVVLCNDKPQTFGAPDVLQLSTHRVIVQWSQDTQFPDRPPNQAVKVGMHMSAAFLNNSSSRWEAIWDAWEFRAELVDHVSPIYRSDFLRNVRLRSGQHLNFNFNPASLLSLGDAMAFTDALFDVNFNDPSFTREPTSLGRPARVGAPENAPQLHEQMAQRGSITSRVPQKYLIQNQSGLRLYYWAEEGPTGAHRTHTLASGVSETLKVEPVRKVLRTVMVGKGGALEKAGNVINLLFEGNWMPVKDVAVSVVGKYRYQMLSPREGDRMPLLVDIILVGRTKIITLHSGMWVDNRTDKNLTFRLHVPVTPLTAPAAPGSGAHSDTMIGPVEPDKGIYLPLTAVLQGRLFVIPEGYQEAQRDVIRLSADIGQLVAQQGHLECQPLPINQGGPVLPVPLHCSLVVTPAQVNSEFQAFKHIEVQTPGELQRASEPLEATLSIHPTLIITNALPYYMEVIVWQVAAFGKLREQQTTADRFKLKYTVRMMQTAYQGLLPIVAADPGQAQAETNLQLERASMAHQSWKPSQGAPNQFRTFSLGPDRADRPLAGQHIVVGLQPGVSQCVYADMRGNVLVHSKVPALGLHAVQWAVVSWAASQKQRETVYDAKYFYRLPHQIRMRNTHKRENLSAHTDDVVAEVKHAARRLRRALLLQRGRKARPRGDSLGQAPPRSGRTSRMADPLIPVAANEAGRSSRNQGAPETTPSGAAAVITSEVDALPGTAWADDEPLHPSSEPAGLAANLTASSQQQPGANSTADSEGDAVEGLAAQSESSSGEEEDSEEVQAALQQLQREIFVAWREAAALRHARRATHTHAGSSRHDAEPSTAIGGGAPDVLYMGLDNSLASSHGTQPLCRLTFFAAYWIDNRTGVNLAFKDHLSAPKSPLLLGARVPFDTTSVRAPGGSLTEISTPNGTTKDIWGVNEASEISVQPVLLNKQDATRFCLSDAGRKRYSQNINIKTVGLKGTHHVRGQDPALPQLTAFMRNSLQAAFKTGQGPVTPEPSGTGFSRPPSMASSLDASGSPNVVNVAMKADELCESVSVDIAEQGQALHTQTSAVKLDISPMLSVDIRPSPAADAAEPAELHVSERLHSDDQSQADPLVAVRLSIVPETEVHSPVSARSPLGPVADGQLGDDTSRSTDIAAGEPKPLKRQGQREYIFTVEVAAGPPNSVFRHTKVVTVKSKYVVENQTGMALEIKQRGTPDLNVNPTYGGDVRCACRLSHDSRAPMHFDDAELSKELVIRPVDDRGRSIWHWSGGFQLRDRDEYFGLRVRLKSNPARAINIPLNSTVGPSGTVLITFKSPRSIPPYRIENQCDDVVVEFAQRGVNKWNKLQPRQGGACMPYAWDEPIQQHQLSVKAHVKVKRGLERFVIEHYSLEHLGALQPFSLPSAAHTFHSASNLQEMASQEAEISKDVKDRVSSLLASEFSRKVYVTVFADGPTRVLQFSDVPNLANPEADLSVLDLAARLKQVEAELQAVSASFARMHGRGELTLDLYGRGTLPAASADVKADASRKMSNMQRRSRLRLRQRQGVTTGPSVPDRVVPAPAPLPRSPAHSYLPPADSGAGGQSSARIEGVPAPRPISLPNVGPADEIVPASPGSSEDEGVQLGSRTSVSQGADSKREMNAFNPAALSPFEVQGSPLMRQAVDGDSALLLGGDLMVSVREAEGLKGTPRNTHTFVRVRVDAQSQLTSVQWSSLAPRWDEVLTFKDVSAASELLVEMWDVGGSRNAKHLETLTNDPTKVINNSRFMGRVEIPLSETLSLRKGARRWHTLMRDRATDDVSGRIRLGFAWDVSARSLLRLKLAVLERIYAQRQEILCMLRPVLPQTSVRWVAAYVAASDAQRKHGEQEEHNAKVAQEGDVKTDGTDVMIGTFLEELHSTLHVDVLEARGLHPRKGVVVAFQANQLPCPEVEITIPGRQPYMVYASHTLKPRFEGTDRGSYKALSSRSPLTVRLYDRKSGRRRTLLGEASFTPDSISGNEPVYVWLPLRPRIVKRFPGNLLSADARQYAVGGSLGQSSLQVFLRLQWERQVVRGQSMRVEVALEGIGVSVMGGLQDELFNLTMDKIEWSAERTRLEVQMRGSIKRLQLDNQMLDATQPVVLAPASAAHAHSETAASLRGTDAPLVTFAVTRSFANNMSAAGQLDTAASLPAGTTNAAAQVSGLQTDKSMEGGAGIWSFKLLSLAVGELDFSADDGFLEAILSFIVSIPTADIWQDEAWREQQRRLLTAQFGPREVENLAMNAVLPLAAQDMQPNAPLYWVQERELHELQVLRDQSSYSSWYFIEQASIGNINANVTIALTSSVLSGRGGVGTAAETGAGGLFSRAIGASGFQLININNVPLSLREWNMQSKLLGRNALINSMIRHYRNAAISEAHKVLGGAGPAIAAVPLTAIWAGTSVVTLLASVGSGRVGPVSVVQRFGFVLFMSLAGVVSSFSRMGLAVMTAIPPDRRGYLSDRGALTRAVQRPTNAFEAFSRANEELVAGFLAALYGLILDPTRGYHQGRVAGHIPDAIIGTVKAMLGIAVRPLAGMTEWVSKGTHGLGLVCLGREAILGSAQRRMRAPGSLADEAPDALDDLRAPELLAQRQRVLAAWQRSLPNLFHVMQDDKLAEVLPTHDKRVLLLTDKHIAMLSVKSLAARSTYKAQWAVGLQDIQFVRGSLGHVLPEGDCQLARGMTTTALLCTGDDDKLRMYVGFSRKLDTGCMGVWTIPHTRAVKCSTRDMLERMTMKVNRHLRAAEVGQKQALEAAFDLSEGSQLTFLDAPYRA